MQKSERKGGQEVERLALPGPIQVLSDGGLTLRSLPVFTEETQYSPPGGLGKPRLCVTSIYVLSESVFLEILPHQVWVMQAFKSCGSRGRQISVKFQASLVYTGGSRPRL